MAGWPSGWRCTTHEFVADILSLAAWFTKDTLELAEAVFIHRTYIEIHEKFMNTYSQSFDFVKDHRLFFGLFEYCLSGADFLRGKSGKDKQRPRK